MEKKYKKACGYCSATGFVRNPDLSIATAVLTIACPVCGGNKTVEVTETYPDTTPDLCCGMYTPPAEKVERFEKVEVKTEDDLPKVAGSYIACLRNGSIYEDYKFIGIDNTFPDTNHWMRHIKWWLRPVK